MAKSLRAKSKQANRRKKRNDENSHYAAVEASRLKAVSDRLLGKNKPEGEGEAAVEGEEEGAEGVEELEEADMGEGMFVSPYLLCWSYSPYREVDIFTIGLVLINCST